MTTTTTTTNTNETPKNSLRGGDTVPAGFYWNRREWALEVLSGEGGVLPGPGDATWLKIPALAMVVLAPTMGGLYVMFLPFIGIALLVNLLARKAAASVEGMAHDLAATLGPEWRPGEAWFTGRPKKGSKKGQPAEPKPDDAPKSEEPKQD